MHEKARLILHKQPHRSSIRGIKRNIVKSLVFKNEESKVERRKTFYEAWDILRGVNYNRRPTINIKHGFNIRLLLLYGLIFTRFSGVIMEYIYDIYYKPRMKPGRKNDFPISALSPSNNTYSHGAFSLSVDFCCSANNVMKLPTKQSGNDMFNA